MQTLSISDFYMPLLSKLSDDTKLDLIAKLSRTMQHKTNRVTKKADIRTCFSGDWENGKSTAEVADELRAARHFDTEKNIEW